MVKLSQLPEVRSSKPDPTGKTGYHHKCGMYIYTKDEWRSHSCSYKKVHKFFRSRTKYLDLKREYFGIWLFFHKIKCSFWNWYLLLVKKYGYLCSHYYDDYKIWLDMRARLRKQHKKMPLSAKDFRFYVYLRKIK